MHRYGAMVPDGLPTRGRDCRGLLTGMVYMSTTGNPFEMLAMDSLELPRTPRGKWYVLVVADYFTR